MQKSEEKKSIQGSYKTFVLKFPDIFPGSSLTLNSK